MYSPPPAPPPNNRPKVFHSILCPPALVSMQQNSFCDPIIIIFVLLPRSPLKFQFRTISKSLFLLVFIKTWNIFMDHYIN